MDVDTRNAAEALLLKANRTHGLPYRQSDIQSALNDPEHGPAFVQWAFDHLEHNFFLSTDELILYSGLDGNGSVDTLAELHDLAGVQAVDEDDIRSAIEELKRSTEKINKQIGNLHQQHDALTKLVKKTAENSSRREDVNLSHQRKTESEHQRIATEVEELSRSVAIRVSDLAQHSEDAEAKLQQAANFIFQKDDKLLRSLQKLGWEINQQNPEEAQMVERIREICVRLIKTTTESVRTRLDTVYLENLASRVELQGTPGQASSSDIKALEEEIESLYSEILPVAQMSIEQEHLDPALKWVAGQSGQSVSRSTAAVKYVNECLEYILARADRVRARANAYKSHEVATTSLMATAKLEMEAPFPSTEPPRLTLPTSPIRNQSPSRLRSNITNTRSRRMSLELAEYSPTESLLSSLALSIPYSEEAGHGDQIRKIAAALSARNQQAKDVGHDVQRNFEACTMSWLVDSKSATQLLRDSVLAESPFRDVKLVDPEIEASILVLEQEVAKVKHGLDMVKEKKPGDQSEREAEFLQRWGG